MEHSLILSLATVFGAGILASLSPCVYPMIPITLGYFGTQDKNRKRTKILVYVLGQALMLTILGIITVKTGESLGFTSQSPVVNLTVGLVLIVAGIFSVVGRMPAFLSKWNEKVPAPAWAGGLAGALLLGAGSALLASPCTTPILSGILALMATNATLNRGILLMLFYTLGFSLILLVLGLGVVQIKQLPRSGAWLNVVHKLSALLLFGAGAYYLWLYYTDL